MTNGIEDRLKGYGRPIIETAQIRAAGRAGDYETWQQLEHEQEAARKAAIARGVEEARESAEKRGAPVELSPIERAALETLVEQLVDKLDDADVPETVILKVCEGWASHLGDSPLRAKLEVAYNLEGDLTGGIDTPGGILDRALDDVIDTLLPYARRARGWYEFYGFETS